MASRGYVHGPGKDWGSAFLITLRRSGDVADSAERCGLTVAQVAKRRRQEAEFKMGCLTVLAEYRERQAGREQRRRARALQA